MNKSITILLITLVALSCTKQDTPIVTDTPKNECDRLYIDSAFIVEDRDIIKLLAGNESHEYFDITEANIEHCQLNQGLGREFFPALYQPKYEPLSNFQYADDMQCIVVTDDAQEYVYPYSLLSQHEVINEVASGEPIVVVFCELAGFAAVYTSVYCGKTFTFAPSGYTYSDVNFWDGLQGIMMWDRETESLWWPLNDFGLSGLMKDVRLQKAPFQLWKDISWGQVKKDHPDALALKPKQRPNIPELPTYGLLDIDCN